MNVELFSVYDQAALRYVDPFCAPTLEFAIRGFKEACQTPEHQFNKFPEDYVLYHVGSFDPELGVLSDKTPHKIAMASSFVVYARPAETLRDEHEGMTEEEWMARNKNGQGRMETSP